MYRRSAFSEASREGRPRGEAHLQLLCLEHVRNITFNEVDLVQWGVFFYWSDWGLYVACALMTVTWCVCAPCALWCLRTPARGDGGSVAPA